MDNNSLSSPPVPKPRRTATELKKTDYENVTIDLINKNLSINSENIQIDTVDKIPNNKILISSIGIDEENNKSILTETNILHEEDDNFNLEKEQNVEKENANRPVPAPRKAQNKEPNQDIYENATVDRRQSTGAISKDMSVLRRAPEIPPKTYLDKVPLSKISPNDNIPTLSSNTFSDNGSKSSSSVTLNSTVSSGSSDNSKYRNPTPGDLLKTLGSTSKLLTESISERVASKAKGATHKLNKNLKNSQDFLNNLSSETSSRLRSVGKQLNTLGKSNFTLTKKSKPTSSAEYDPERPQTVPPNDHVFQSISFNSPLNKTTKIYDLTSAEPNYEVPRDIQVEACPSYEDAMKETFERNAPATKSLGQRGLGLSLPGTSSETDLNDLSGTYTRKSFGADDSLPMPSFPPPALPNISPEPTYGKLKPIRPPARPKRKSKIYESIELRKAPATESNRATADSTDSSMRDVSMEIEEIIKAQEQITPKPDRSESWQYYEGNDEDDMSSPEPVYANNEATYGKLFEMECSNKDILAPAADAPARQRPGSLNASSTPKKELLYEFDPLAGKHLTICRTDKSNQLLLLEHLLEEETYGAVAGATARRDQSECSSEDDNASVASSLPIPPDRSDSLDDNEANPKSHNTNEEVDEAAPYLARIEEDPTPKDEAVDLSRNPKKQTNWFVETTPPTTSRLSQRFNPFNKNSKFDKSESPPTYLEAISGSADAPEPKSPARTGSVFSKSMFSNVLSKVDALKRKTSFRSNNSDVKVAVEMIPRPTFSQMLVRHEGPLIRFPSGVVEDILKEMQNRKAMLRDRQFLTYLDQDMKNIKETIPLDFITTIQCVSNSRITDNSTHLYCFEITTATPKNQSHQLLTNPNVVITSGNSGNCKLQRACHLYGIGKESERDIWMQKLIESLTDVFPSSYTCQYYRAGWCYLKKSITAEWSGAWIILKKRKRRLLVQSEADMILEKIDLRKARCVVKKESDETVKKLHVEHGPTLMIDCPPHTVYLIMASAQETKLWRQAIREVAHNNGPLLSDQQLTKFNVPVLVDKCINYIYIHGSMSEGIYRKSGSENSIQKLISQFRSNAFNVEITRNEYNEHDVANVLKRFMRDLPQRLLGKYSESFISIAALHSKKEKIASYKELLGRLQIIEFETLKKIVGHLTFINSQRETNKMGVENLAVIWGPTLLQSRAEEMAYSQMEANVVVDLITLYKSLFPLSEDDAKKEQEMLMCLQKYYAAAESLTDSVKISGDIKLWVAINPNPENNTEELDMVNVTISPTKTAYEVCKEVSAKMKLATHQLTLYEVIMNGSLERPLHHDAKVFDIVLKWSYWPEDDRKNNTLVVRPIDILKEVERAIKNCPTVTPGKELKFADCRTKSFKLYQIEMKNGKIMVLKKEKNGAHTLVKEIFLQGCTVYLGCEKKREFPWSWAITFLDNTNNKIVRTRDSPFIGHVVAGTEWVDRIIWYSSIWYSLHSESIMPPAEIIIN